MPRTIYFLEDPEDQRMITVENEGQCPPFLVVRPGVGKTWVPAEDVGEGDYVIFTPHSLGRGFTVRAVIAFPPRGKKPTPMWATAISKTKKCYQLLHPGIYDIPEYGLVTVAQETYVTVEEGDRNITLTPGALFRANNILHEPGVESTEPVLSSWERLLGDLE